MNGFWGADTEALRTMGTVYSRRAEALADLETLLTSTIDNLEWIGEDADRFRADWSGVVRPSLQDQGVELRQRARRLVQHADEQEEASAPDGPMGGAGGGGGWSSPGEFLRDVAAMTDGALRDLLGGGPGGQRGPFAELLREVLSTPEGRAAFLGGSLGSLLGGLLADMITRAIGMGMALENLLTGLGLGGGLGNLIGESGQLMPQDALQAEPSPAEGGQAAGGGGGPEAAGGGSGGEASGGSGGGRGAEAGAETGADAGEAGAPASGRPMGFQGLEDGPAQSAGSGPSGRYVAEGVEEPRSLLERLLEMLGDAVGPGTGSASSIGEDIGSSGLGGPRS